MMPASIRPIALRLCLALLGLILVAGTGCETSADAPKQAVDASPARQTAFRVRSDVDAGLNADQGWAGPLNQPVALPVETPFRLRFEAETPRDAPFVERSRLQYRRNGSQ